MPWLAWLAHGGMHQRDGRSVCGVSCALSSCCCRHHSGSGTTRGEGGRGAAAAVEQEGAGRREMGQLVLAVGERLCPVWNTAPGSTGLLVCWAAGGRQ